MKTIIATALHRRYVEVRPSKLPSSLSKEWADGITAKLRELFGRVDVVEDMRMDAEGLLHIDIKHCSDKDREYLMGIVLGMLVQLGLHDFSHKVEYCDLTPGIGEE